MEIIFQSSQFNNKVKSGYDSVGSGSAPVIYDKPYLISGEGSGAYTAFLYGGNKMIEQTTTVFSLTRQRVKKLHWQIHLPLNFPAMAEPLAWSTG